MSNKQILNGGISLPEESLAHFDKVWSAAAGGKKGVAVTQHGFASGVAQYAIVPCQNENHGMSFVGWIRALHFIHPTAPLAEKN